jgi:antitoxin component YwqK of YwqJK toxin-antitoxin module
MKRALLFLLMTLSISAYCQPGYKKMTTVYASGRPKEQFMIDDKGLKQGTYVKYYENGVKQFEFNYHDGLKNGKSVTRFMNGKINIEMHYIDDKPSGSYKAWDELGNLIEQATY